MRLPSPLRLPCPAVRRSRGRPGCERCSGAACPDEWKPGWQELADRIEAPVYCPSWLPAPLTGELDGDWHSTQSIKRDRSYLMGFIC